MSAPLPRPPEGAPHVLVGNVFFAPNSYGGATIVAEEVARALQARHGWQVSAVSAISRRDLPDYALRRAQSGAIASYLINLPERRDAVQMYDNPRVGEILARLIRSLAPDLLHLHCLQELGVAPLEAARAAGLPTVLSVHDFWWICERQFMIRPDGRYCAQDPVRIEACQRCGPDLGPMRHRQDRLRAAASAAALMTFPSDFARTLCLASGLVPPRAEVWRNGITLPGPGFFARQARRRAEDPRLVFGFCGGPSELKGWPLIRSAFAGLNRRDFRVVLADGALRDSWWRGIDLRALPGDWRVHPRYSQAGMDEFWSGIDVLLFPSQWKETFGLTLREALARGIRVIQTDSGGTMEHSGPDRDRALPLGAPASALQQEILFALRRPDRLAPPVPVDSFADQADRFVALTAPLLEARPHPARPLRLLP
ncbi:glycosyltransferase [Pseudooceanicola sp. CBS1P-1]|uniref:Glycosyltransferase n=1 Tax=Pseudooceanicola albus TaxID=2692189 RepID=A0A6L7G8V4_9RHOB|nr:MULTISPECIES: glycosyltransferase [Pseudooceanicola]MBT9386443.1 glycosyltransferase [Pseudooceanicola endophyticus]MXN20399.1 glycosyltransferase [Pseudooceanicola albus]